LEYTPASVRLSKRREGGAIMSENGKSAAADQALLAEEAQRYLEAHPELVERLRRAEKVYRIFGNYLNLVQPKVILRETIGSNAEVDLSAALSRANSSTA
jgi:hypothetical protein